jgi:hypothetical protein
LASPATAHTTVKRSVTGLSYVPWFVAVVTQLVTQIWLRARWQRLGCLRASGVNPTVTLVYSISGSTGRRPWPPEAVFGARLSGCRDGCLGRASRRACSAFAGWRHAGQGGAPNWRNDLDRCGAVRHVLGRAELARPGISERSAQGRDLAAGGVLWVPGRSLGRRRLNLWVKGRRSLPSETVLRVCAGLILRRSPRLLFVVRTEDHERVTNVGDAPQPTWVHLRVSQLVRGTVVWRPPRIGCGVEIDGKINAFVDVLMLVDDETVRPDLGAEAEFEIIHIGQQIRLVPLDARYRSPDADRVRRLMYGSGRQ